jgi:glycosyltransferase involved in cell wall biosynthesis
VTELPTIGIVTTCHTYTSFLPGWCGSVHNLNTAPDRVVVACTDPATTGSAMTLDDYELVQVAEPFGLGKYLNAAIEKCDTDWIVWIGADDRYRMHALDGLRFSQADVVAMGMQFSQGGYWHPTEVSPSAVLAVNENFIPCGSAFRRSLWQQIPFQPHLAPFEDWALWVGFAHLGARFASTGRIDFDYGQHPDQIVPDMEPTRSRIAEWAKGLT